MEERNSSLKSSLVSFLRNAWDLFILQMLWIICSLPVITMGPATSALFSVTLKIARDEPASAIKDFFTAFKADFKQALVLGLISLAGAVIIYSDIVYALSLEGNFKTLFLIVSGIMITLWLIFTTFSFPLQARYENSLKMHIRNSFLAAFGAPGKTIRIWIVYAIPMALLLFSQDVFIYIGWIFIFYGVTIPVFINSKTLRTIFDKISGETDHDKDSSNQIG